MSSTGGSQSTRSRGAAVDWSFDTASYRYGHPLLGWLGWVLSAGQATIRRRQRSRCSESCRCWRPASAAAVLGLLRGRSGAEALFVALNPGLLYAAAHDLTEPLSAALLLGAFYGYICNRRPLLLACLALLPLSKEAFLVVPLALAAWELARRGRRIVDVVPLLATLIPAVIWWTYARLTLGAWFTSGDTALGFPLRGWARSLVDSGIHSFAGDAAVNQLGEVTVVLLVSLLGLLLVAGLRCTAGCGTDRAGLPPARRARSVPRPDRHGTAARCVPEHGCSRRARAVRPGTPFPCSDVASTRRDWAVGGLNHG